MTAATKRIGQPPGKRFTGHLTIARGVGRGRISNDLAGAAIDGEWTATEVAIIRSHLSGDGARYETLTSLPVPTRRG